MELGAGTAPTCCMSPRASHTVHSDDLSIGDVVHGDGFDGDGPAGGLDSHQLSPVGSPTDPASHNPIAAGVDLLYIPVTVDGVLI